ncbi:metal ABC transporter substrate-binding protein [Paenibacillus apiarius]|uniref:metal ABC transporter substrate-binding protein n=1 Tax=Paenibacillus apiarius TaxID=46240 RepID=UPI00197FE3BF|nr:metal ABC transporter substrate-binding protein [Paenibacillus apiarius]MBN3523621.1 metal ABC transporter substrate-binding protein [Paenibacillus apiarius]
MKKRNLLLTVVMAISMLALAACGGQPVTEKASESNDKEKLQVITTYSIIYDIVKNVGGDRLDVHSLAPIGSDPHQYDPLPEDVKKTTDADLVFYNGLNLETGDGWFEKMIETAGKTGENAPVFKVSEGVQPMYLKSGGHEGEEDPHAWLDVENGIIYTENVMKALIQVDPDHKETYEKNANAYIEQLKKLHESVKQKMNELPKEKRILVSSEGAFKYFSNAYGFDAYYIWEINSHDEGTPEQLKSIIDIIRSHDVKALFVETSVDARSMETVSSETGVPIAGTIFTDSLGKPGEAGDTYMKMIESNADIIYNGLKDK